MMASNAREIQPQSQGVIVIENENSEADSNSSDSDVELSGVAVLGSSQPDSREIPVRHHDYGEAAQSTSSTLNECSPVPYGAEANVVGSVPHRSSPIRWNFLRDNVSPSTATSPYHRMPSTERLLLPSRPIPILAFPDNVCRGPRSTTTAPHNPDESPVRCNKPDNVTCTKPAAHEDDDDDGQCCPICFDVWTNSGDHRLVSLKCGHLFGQSCIVKWLRGTGEGKCPQCNVKAKPKDIRLIYAKYLKVTDTSEKDAALLQLEKEREARRQAEMQAAEARMLLQMAKDECQKLASEITKQRQLLDHYTGDQGSSSLSSNMASPSSLSSLYTIHKVLKISEAGDCRVMEYCPSMATLCISQPSSSPLFPGFGVKKVSVLDYRTCQYVSIHSKPIRDMCAHHEEDMLLTASMDKTIKMTSLSSNAVVLSYDLPMPVWSCAWNREDPLYLYAGMQNGVVHVFDTRNTAGHVTALNTEGSRSPVVTLQYVLSNPTVSFRSPGLIVGQLDRTCLYEFRAGEYKPHMLPLEANLTSVSFDSGSRHLLATYRPTKRDPSVKHMLYEMTERSGDIVCRNLHTLYGGSTMKLLSRSQLVPHPQGHGGLIAAGDEASQSVYIWDASTGLLVQKLPVNAPVLDISHICQSDSQHLVALTDKQISLFKSAR